MDNFKLRKEIAELETKTRAAVRELREILGAQSPKLDNLIAMIEQHHIKQKQLLGY